MKVDACHYIAGQWVKGSNSPLISINPATENPIWEGNLADQETVNKAVLAAKKAFPEWSVLPFDERLKYFDSFQKALLNMGSKLAEAISKSMGKPLWESITEVKAMVNKIAISIESFQVRCPTIKKEQALGLAMTSHRAHGVMAVLGPFNFPGHLPNGHIVPALLAGNTVVFKPSELTPLVAELMIKCWESCHLPHGVINMVQGSKETGHHLSTHEEIDGLLFTGSWFTGKQLAESMAKTPYKILALEMGGNNPLIIGNISDLKAAAYTTIQSAFLTSGQRCTCARRLIVPQGAQEEAFLQVLIEMIRTIHIGAYDDPIEPFMGPVASKKAAENLIIAQQTLIASGGIPLLTLSQLKQGSAFLTPGLIDVTHVPKAPDEEYFGPFLQVIRVNDFNEAIQEAKKTRYGLSAGLLSNSHEEYRRFFKSVKAGIINWNTALTGASSLAPFGGVGQSGNNRPSAFYAADYCAYPVASLISNELVMPPTLAPGMNL